MNVLFISDKDKIINLIQNNIYNFFQITNLSLKTDLQSIEKYNDYDLCIVDADLGTALSENVVSLSSYFLNKKKEIITSSTVFIFISNDNNNLKFYIHEAFKNILTFKYTKTEHHNIAKIDRFIRNDLLTLVILKKHRKSIKLCLFVHGFNGGKDTWDQLENLINHDPELKKYKLGYFNYASFGFELKNILRKFKIRNYTNVKGLAGSLKETIRSYDFDELILVGHSLGCLVIKKFLLLNHKNKWSLNPQKVILFAPPNQGSRLADLLFIYSFTNPHVLYLSFFSFKRRIDNFKWRLQKLENQTNIKVLIATNDKTVRTTSASHGVRKNNLVHFHDTNHIDIKEPGSHNSTIYKTFKRCLEE